MASAMHPSSFLPCIKCSNCGNQIEISMMGDHVCKQALPQPECRPIQPPLDAPFAPSPFIYRKIEPQGPRAALPKINSSVANYHYRHNPFAPVRPTNLSRSESPHHATQDSIPPFSSLNRSATLPLTPPSPEARPQDGAFPIFPTKSKSRSNTPITPSEPTFPLAAINGASESPVNSFDVYAPTNPQRKGGEDVMKRLDAISPGPFDADKDRALRISGHKRTTTSSSTEDFIRSPVASSFKGHSPKHSNASSYHSRNASIASLAGGPRCNKSAENPSLPVLSRDTGKPFESAGRYNGNPNLYPSKASDPRPSIGELGRSQTSPVGNASVHEQLGRPQTSPAKNAGYYGGQDTSSIAQRTDADATRIKPSLHRPKPSVAAAIRPLDEIGSMSSFKPSRSFKGRKPSTATESKEPQPSPVETGNDQRQHNAPPVPRHAAGLGYNIGNPYHLSTESTSSNDSSGSDMKTSSSRSTPPPADSPQRLKPKADITRLDNLLSEFKLDLENAPVLEPPPSSRWEAPPSFSRPLYSRPIERSPNRESTQLSPTTISKPADRVDPSPPQPHATSPDNSFPSTYLLQQGTQHGYPGPSPLPPPQAPLPRPRKTVANKGHCRGCGELIMGKSVSSADGRLTGRYHKACFVCKTCKEPFQTTDFYVMNNEPYCGRHYHQLNGSLCKKCDGGIEGQYLETEVKQKFHPNCFTCQDCQQILRDDYFEMNGNTYCEQHALRVSERTRFLGPGRRHPERRTTRLMMM